jgi:hypothetical protein
VRKARVFVVLLPLVLAGAAAVAFFPGLRAVDPHAAFYLTVARGVDPWGRPWLGPANEGIFWCPLYSVGPDGVDETRVYLEIPERRRAARDRMSAHLRHGHELTSGVVSHDATWTCSICSDIWAEQGRVEWDLVERAAAGPKGDDVFFEPSALGDFLRSHAPIEPWILAPGAALSFFLAADPRAPRSRSRAREATRVLLLAIGPAAVFLIVGHVALDAVKPVFPAWIVSPEVALTTTSVLAALVLALSLRPGFPANEAATDTEETTGPRPTSNRTRASLPSRGSEGASRGSSPHPASRPGKRRASSTRSPAEIRAAPHTLRCVT